jgi:hypothetical protein
VRKTYILTGWVRQAQYGGIRQICRMDGMNIANNAPHRFVAPPHPRAGTVIKGGKFTLPQ